MKRICNNVELHERLRILRSDKTQTRIAKELGINQQTYANWELGNRQPKLQDLVAIAFHFGVSTDWLLGLDAKDMQPDLSDSNLNVKITNLKKTATEASESVNHLLDSIRKLEEVL